ncbi:hypothetical protein QD460_25190 [Rhizobium jaguaris]|uniref:Type IV secretion system protein VirB7 n=1 Tax=Rhizobium jaguaris TaxID=1312183 RepID=A0A387G445_9HYPH|nr:hypothetical protein [Rhizobium jaguaris]AYG62366.1 hypothetical protein CCGE525_26610 [Rhizobium jaguaris]
MLRILVLLCIASVLSTCASRSHSLPKCDGYARRPLNRAMWQWDGDKRFSQQKFSPAAGPASTPASFVEEEVDIAPAAFAHFDQTDSYRPCAGQN